MFLIGSLREWLDVWLMAVSERDGDLDKYLYILCGSFLGQTSNQMKP